MAPRTPKATAAVPSAAQDAEAANAVVAAQAIEENASANVARRDDVCLRRNWLRRDTEAKLDRSRRRSRRQNPESANNAAKTASSVSTATIGANTNAIMPITASTLAQRIRREVIGAVATSSGASSPEIDSLASLPASWPAAWTFAYLASPAV